MGKKIKDRKAKNNYPKPIEEDSESAANENFLETEAPHNDRRDRISKEYTSDPPAALPGLNATPDGRETYPEEETFYRARGENVAGSSQGESQVKTLGNPEQTGQGDEKP